ncbi:MAG TPA: hypothetical protein VG015_07440 [Candidatus Dormibacteraeota bacterium]|nr:hypothetical protein [Candidatus Dormibacteraeota bacterium]
MLGISRTPPWIRAALTGLSVAVAAVALPVLSPVLAHADNGNPCALAPGIEFTAFDGLGGSLEVQQQPDGSYDVTVGVGVGEGGGVEATLQPITPGEAGIQVNADYSITLPSGATGVSTELGGMIVADGQGGYAFAPDWALTDSLNGWAGGTSSECAAFVGGSIPIKNPVVGQDGSVSLQLWFSFNYNPNDPLASLSPFQFGTYYTGSGCCTAIGSTQTPTMSYVQWWIVSGLDGKVFEFAQTPGQNNLILYAVCQAGVCTPTGNPMPPGGPKTPPLAASGSGVTDGNAGDSGTITCLGGCPPPPAPPTTYTVTVTFDPTPIDPNSPAPAPAPAPAPDPEPGPAPDPALSDPSADPASGSPEPAPADPAQSDPSSTDPSASDPFSSDPSASGSSSYGDPGYNDPNSDSSGWNGNGCY